MFRKLINLKFLFWIIVFLTLFLRGIIFLDPDFGWRLKSGELILQQGIIYSDPFSYSMPTYSWVNHAWLTDVFIATLYSKFGYVGLSLVFSLLTITTFQLIYSLIKDIPLNKKNRKFNYWYLAAPIIILATASFFRFSGIRAQVFSWLFMAILYNLILRPHIWRRWRYFIPVFFCIWVNFHGGFAAGLLTLVMFLGIKWFREKKADYVDLIIVTFSIMATFVNPYGTGVYKEVWDTVSDKVNHKYILEWNSFFKSFNLPSLFVIAISLPLVYGYRKKLKLEEVFIYLFYIYLALSTVRQLPFFAMVAFYISYKVIADFYNNLKEKVAIKRFSEIYRAFTLIAILVLMVELLLTFVGAYYYSINRFYPHEAVSYLSKNFLEGRIFSKYDYGGYLIWKLPEKKVFIDGRMPHWRREVAPIGESENAMKEYMSVFTGETGYHDLFKKYDVETVLWSNNANSQKIKEVDNFLTEKLKFIYALTGVKKQDNNLIEDLEKDGWRKIYSDNVSVIYKKP